jgi:hypothetical protein
MAEFAFDVDFEITLVANVATILAFFTGDSFFTTVTFQTGSYRKHSFKQNFDAEAIAFGTGIITKDFLWDFKPVVFCNLIGDKLANDIILILFGRKNFVPVETFETISKTSENLFHDVAPFI